jgi:hypothetical protein
MVEKDLHPAGSRVVSGEALVVEKVDGEWDERAAFIVGVTNTDHRSVVWYAAKVKDGRKKLDALADKEAL